KVLLWRAVGKDVEAFLGAMEELGPKCGPLVVQLPYFDRHAFGGVDEFLERLEPFLEGLPPGFRYAVEVRNKAWIGAELPAGLRSGRVARVPFDIASLPHPADLARDHDLATADFSYVRLIGDRQAIEAKTDAFDRIVVDQGARLDRWAELLEGLLSRVREVY